MNRTNALVGLGMMLAGCGSPDPGTKINLPNIELSSTDIDFGDVNWNEPVTRDLTIRNSGGSPMGVGQIALTQDGYEGNFTVAYDFAEVVCDSDDGSSTTPKTDDSGATDDSGTKARRADAKDVAPDTGFYKDTGDTGTTTAVQQVLDPGCQIPVHITMNPVDLGEVKAGLLVLTVDEPTDRNLSYYRDPDEEYKIVVLEGNAINEKGLINVDPIRLDFGFVWAGETGVRYVTVRNVGKGDLNLADYEFAKSCGDEFSVTAGYDSASGLLLEPGDSTSLEISYLPLTPQDVTTAPSCTMKIHSDDPNVPEAEVEITENQEGQSIDTPPVVELISPQPGHIVNEANLEIELDMWDANQPANSLGCYIRSAHLKKSRIADCVPTDASGHVVVEIPVADTLEAGTDTIEVEVTDAFGQKAIATTTVLYLTPFPDNDVDKDGYVSTAFGGDDCDDNDNTTYPEAAEIPDGKDNNCEPASKCVAAACAGALYNPCIDEGTILGDDDKDCYVEAPVGTPGVVNGGDCNDWVDFGANTYPGAAEIPDSIDNDCDGIVDENTSAYDDDGDGFDEFNGDFDDSDPTINPGATEYCDGIDNDCDDIIDNAGACIATDTIPIIVGGAAGVMDDKTDISVGQSVNIGVVGFDADGDPLSYAWTQDEALGSFVAIDNVAGPVVTFTAPDSVVNGQDKYKYTLQVVVTDNDGNQDWAYGYIWVHKDPVELTRTVGATTTGCKSNNAAVIPVLPMVLLAWASRRKKKIA